MKKIINYCSFAILLAVIVIPLVFINTDEEAISEIDNKYLAENPFETNLEGVFTENCEAYVSERIGFREKEIFLYTVANDILFDEMVHPTYSYGKDGYVFLKFSDNREYTEYEEDFIHMLSEIQTYCNSRGVPFVFVFEPSKASIYKDKLPEGYNYNDEWVAEFLGRLDEEGINYVDTSEVLKLKREEGIDGFNVKYNAGHWNDIGAFYGMNAVLENLNAQGLNVHINREDEYEVNSELRTSLMVSEFPISEYEPVYSLINEKKDIEAITDDYTDEVKRNEDFPGFGYVINSNRGDEECVNALVFQGSYINGMGWKFLENAFNEYVAVQNYQNILNLDYYFNIFQPDCVVLDAAQYTFSDVYFGSEGMSLLDLSPRFEEFEGYDEIEYNVGNIEVEKGDKITNIVLTGIPEECEYAYYCSGDEEYDMSMQYDSEKETKFFTLSLKNEDWNDGEIYLIDSVNNVKYQIEI